HHGTNYRCGELGWGLGSPPRNLASAMRTPKLNSILLPSHQGVSIPILQGPKSLTKRDLDPYGRGTATPLNKGFWGGVQTHNNYDIVVYWGNSIIPCQAVANNAKSSLGFVGLDKVRPLAFDLNNNIFRSIRC
ncbi:hypothetical protein AMTR_s00003p00271700, partial [Amborella trichopoda]